MLFPRLKSVPQPSAGDLTAYWSRREMEGRKVDLGLIRGFSEEMMHRLVAQGFDRKVVHALIEAKVREYTIETHAGRVAVVRRPEH